MSQIELDGVEKVFPDGTPAVRGIDLTIEAGEFMVLVGPSGCGKSTVLRMIAGLEGATSGRILVGGRDVTNAPPRDRDVAMVFQNYALYPHMSVRDNLGFSLKVGHTPKAEMRKRVDDVAHLLELEELLNRKPAQLSGGQRQRVAMGRAIVRQPTAYLMDEPLSNLDAKLRVSMRAELTNLHQRLAVTTVYVTHDQVEAMTLGQRVAVIDGGLLQQVDQPQEIYRKPTNVFVAAFIGSPSMNLVNTRIDDQGIRFGQYLLPLTTEQHSSIGARDEVIVGLRPEDFALAPDRSGSLPIIDVDIQTAEHLGAESHVFFGIDAPSTPLLSGIEGISEARNENSTRCVARVSSDHMPAAGERLPLRVRVDRMHFFDADSGEAL